MVLSCRATQVVYKEVVACTNQKRVRYIQIWQIWQWYSHSMTMAAIVWHCCHVITAWYFPSYTSKCHTYHVQKMILCMSCGHLTMINRIPHRMAIESLTDWWPSSNVSSLKLWNRHVGTIGFETARHGDLHAPFTTIWKCRILWTSVYGIQILGGWLWWPLICRYGQYMTISNIQMSWILY